MIRSKGRSSLAKILLEHLFRTLTWQVMVLDQKVQSTWLKILFGQIFRYETCLKNFIGAKGVTILASNKYWTYLHTPDLLNNNIRDV